MTMTTKEFEAAYRQKCNEFLETYDPILSEGKEGIKSYLELYNDGRKTISVRMYSAKQQEAEGKILIYICKVRVAFVDFLSEDFEESPGDLDELLGWTAIATEAWEDVTPRKLSRNFYFATACDSGTKADFYAAATPRQLAVSFYDATETILGVKLDNRLEKIPALESYLDLVLSHALRDTRPVASPVEKAAVIDFCEFKTNKEDQL